MNIREKFEGIAREHIKREGLDKLLAHLANTDFYTAPASTKYHDAEEGGLVKHSIKVFEHLSKECGKKYSMETIAIVALFHDICKIGCYQLSMRNTKDEKGKWIQVPYYTFDDNLPLGHGEKSVIMLITMMPLGTEEIMAIRWHMGAYCGENNWNTLSKAFSEFPLALYLHIADMKATYLK